MLYLWLKYIDSMLLEPKYKTYLYIKLDWLS